eukprot:COSAG06_NODE_6726_length_2808_cov_13.626061_1_plen_162_part_00
MAFESTFSYLSTAGTASAPLRTMIFCNARHAAQRRATPAAAAAAPLPPLLLLLLLLLLPPLGEANALSGAMSDSSGGADAARVVGLSSCAQNPAEHFLFPGLFCDVYPEPVFANDHTSLRSVRESGAQKRRRFTWRQAHAIIAAASMPAAAAPPPLAPANP